MAGGDALTVNASADKAKMADVEAGSETDNVDIDAKNEMEAVIEQIPEKATFMQ
jgi:hypothetical protein